MCARRVAADERDRLDRRVVADEVDGVVGAVDDVEHALRHPRLDRQLRQSHCGERHALRGLEDEGVAADGGHREHPERDHRGEVERRDPAAHAERHAVRVNVDARRHVLHRLAHLEAGGAARVLHHLQPPEDVPLRVVDRLAVLHRQYTRQLLRMLADERLQPEHHARAVGDGGARPRGERRLGGGGGGVHLALGGDGGVREHALRRGADDFDVLGRLRLDKLAVDE
mmetsp:Transcript_31156/g.65290  ORF Transcript_31156/g.65290 Transcript_31156/m.65290 type:complete len:227 (+) Transcript_31156:1573-2253(+)